MKDTDLINTAHFERLTRPTLLPPSEAQQETSEICRDARQSLACEPDLPTQFQSWQCARAS